MKRLDSTLVEWGLAPSRSKAQELIRAGEVLIQIRGEWRVETDKNFDVTDLSRAEVRIAQDARSLKYVSRGGLKLEGAFRHLRLNPAGWRCLDVGQSTGGFTDCLLQSGARAVLGVDVGHGQLSARIARDSRVEALEGVDARAMATDPRVQRWLKGGVDGAVVDVSFISLDKILPGMSALLPSGTPVVALVKPQFEAGPRTVQEEMFDDIRGRVLRTAENCGFSVEEYFPSTVKGQDGNQEFFLFCRRR